MKHLIILCILLSCSSLIGAQQLEHVLPWEVGMDASRLAVADSVLLRAVRQGEIPGAVLAVVRHGKMAYLKAYGQRALEPMREPMSVDTQFDMASCSKPMSTALSAMILIEQGKLRLQDAVSLYLPGFTDWVSADGKRRVTIRVQDLLTHTSGLPPYAPVAQLQEQYGSPCPDSLMRYIATCPRDFEPRTDFQYSCINYVTLQHIIETITGESLRDFARRHIFQPLGMEHTDYYPCHLAKEGRWVNTPSTQPMQPIAPTERQSSGQVLRGQVHDPLARILQGGISGNAGLFSTASDIAILCAMLQNGGSWDGHRILSPLGVEAMRRVPREVAAFGRTPGWDVSSPYASCNGNLLSPSTYGHTGYTGTSIVIDPETDTSVILLTNAVHPVDEKSVVRLRTLVANAVAASILCPYGQESCGIQPTPHYRQRYLQFAEEQPITGQDLVMLGNSLTEGGGDWAKRLGMKHVVNRGIVGDDVPGITQRLHQILTAHPRAICLLTGANDVSHDLSVDSIARSICRLAAQILSECPETHLYLQSLLPINESFGRYKRLNGKTSCFAAINTQLEAWVNERHDPRLTFVNLYPLFTESAESEVLKAELTTDGLHLREEGYRIWAKALRKALK
ncbi:MAG: serine hydrolase [Bacteroides sp.]